MAVEERRISLGVYPDIGLAEARDRREAARKLVAQGIDSAEQRRQAKATLIADTVNTRRIKRPSIGGDVIWSPLFVTHQSASRNLKNDCRYDFTMWLATDPNSLPFSGHK